MEAEPRSTLRDGFESFLSDRCASVLRSLAESYPEEDVFRFSYRSLSEYDATTARLLATNQPAATRIVSEVASAHECHDAIRLPNLLAVPTDAPRRRSLTSPSRQIGTLCRFPVRVASVSQMELAVDTAKLECVSCGTSTYHRQQSPTEFLPDSRRRPPDSGLDTPTECDDCGATDSFEVRPDGSTFEPVQQIDVVDARESYRGGEVPDTREVLLRKAAAGSVSSGDWGEIVGYQRPFLTEDSRTARLETRGFVVDDLDPTRFDPDPLLDPVVPGRGERYDLTREHLLGYARHVSHIRAGMNESDRYGLPEAETKLKLIEPLIDLLGWDRHSPQVRMECDIGGGPADYVLWRDSDPAVVVEAKALGESLAANARSQLRGYMTPGTARWGLLTDGEQFQVYQLGEEKTPFQEFLNVDYRLLHRHVDELSYLTVDGVTGFGNQ